MSVVPSLAPDWADICAFDELPVRGARRVETSGAPIAIFRTGDDRVFALIDRCPHKHGPLSMGIVHGHQVTCPLHAMVINLASGEPIGADSGKGCAPPVSVRIHDGRVLLALPAA